MLAWPSLSLRRPGEGPRRARQASQRQSRSAGPTRRSSTGDPFVLVTTGRRQQRAAGQRTAPVCPRHRPVWSDPKRLRVEDEQPRPPVGQDSIEDAWTECVEIARCQDVLATRVVASTTIGSLDLRHRTEGVAPGRGSDVATRDAERGATADGSQDVRDLGDRLGVPLHGARAVRGSVVPVAGVADRPMRMTRPRLTAGKREGVVLNAIVGTTTEPRP